ncbi:MAG: PAS domain-containing sensor histidine kinase [Rubrivivax sp.]|nr:PAS domain-containing sensor histidine kinase [Rubrivivax sp.]
MPVAHGDTHLHEVAEHFPGMAYRVHMPFDSARPARYTFVSRGVQLLYGVGPEAVMANPRVLRQFRHPDDSDRLDAEVAAAVLGGRQLLTTYRILVDGGIKWIQMSSSVVGVEAGEQIRVGAMVDVTAQVQAEALRRDRDRAEADRQQMTQFLSRVSHELRTPLNAILGFAQLIETESDTPGLQRRWARGLMDSGRHLLSLVEDVLDLSGAQSGQMALQLDDVDLGPVLREAWSMVSADAQERGLDFSGLPLVAGQATVRADRRRLLQVLANLLSNAVKSNRPGGPLGLHVRHEGPLLAIAVSDGGAGLEPERLSRLFTPFDRLGAQHTKVPGTGLGLAVSRQLAERMGGSLVADSEPGRGSVFTLRLPAV